jgi:hypothetical protein
VLVDVPSELGTPLSALSIIDLPYFNSLRLVRCLLQSAQPASRILDNSLVPPTKSTRN